MIKRLRSLDLFQKAVLIALAIMIALFTVLYIRADSRSGIVYKGAFLYRGTEGENTVYSGELHDKKTRFTVSPDGKVLYQYGDKSFGGYLVNRDDSLITYSYRGEAKAGVEIWRDGQMLFRGMVINEELLIDKLGNHVTPPSYVIIGGAVYAPDENGGHEVDVDPDEPSLNAIAQFALGLDQKHKGAWGVWVICVLLSIVIAITILFADELFRWGMRFYIRNAHNAKPSDWELTRRHLGWILCPIVVLIMFIVGLNTIV